MWRRLKAAVAVWFLLACLVSQTTNVSAAPGPGSLPGLRIAVAERGMVRLSYETLKGAGVPLDGLDPAQLALWQRDEPIALELVGTEDGAFGAGDALIFYGEPYASRYMTRNIYRLTWSGGGERIATRDATPDPTGFSTIGMVRLKLVMTLIGG